MLAKLYLGATAASRGFDVIVGDQKEIVRGIYRLKPGIYIDKSVARTKSRFFGKLIQLGYQPVALCEEGLVYRDKERYIKERIDPETLGMTARFFCWGQNQKRDVCNATLEKGKLRVVGNPRFDMLRPEFREIWTDESRRIRERFGPFILVNTNFSRYNRLPGTDDVIQLLRKRGTLDSASGINYYQGLVQHLSYIMSAFVVMLPELAKRFPFHTIIIRPHPGENFNPYMELAQGEPRLRVEYGGSVIPWLLAADAVIHNSCTTGVEGWVLGKPVISYMPVENASFDSQLPNSLSHVCNSSEALFDTLERILSKEAESERDSATLQIAADYIDGLEGKFAADRLIDNLPEHPSRNSIFARVKEGVRASTKGYLRKIPGLRVSNGLKTLSKQKFPGMEQYEAENFIRLVERCRPDLKNIQLCKMAGWKNVFHIALKE